MPIPPTRAARRSRPLFAALLLAALCPAVLAAVPDPAAEPASPFSPSAPADHVVLISVDGLRPELYLDDAWPAPMMQQMRDEGVHARGVVGVFPSVTYPSHTTMVTGALPARHGVYYNEPFEEIGLTGRWYWDEAAVRVPTLWDAVRAAGGTSAAVNWPVTVGAPIDFNLPEVWDPTPGSVPLEAMRRAENPPGLTAEVEREASGPLTAETFTIEHLTRDDRAGDVAAYLLTRYRPTLLAVHIIGTDEQQHQHGRDGRIVRRAVAAADRAIAQTVEAAERAGMLDRTTFLITGDHGHQDRHTRVHPNVWLMEAGLLALEDPEKPGFGARWKSRRAAFHGAAGAAFLHLADPEDKATLARVREILREKDPGGRLFRVVERDELARLGAAPEAALALVGEPGVDFTSDAGAPALRPTSGATHGYLPTEDSMLTGFLGWGAGFKGGVAVERLHLTDVAPLVARLLGLDFEAPDGVLAEGVVAVVGSQRP